MSLKLYNESSIQSIANSIRAKNGSSITYTVEEMPAAILAIPTGGGDVSVVPLTATENKTYTAPSGTAYSPVTVSVPIPTFETEEVTVIPTKSQQVKTPTKDGYSKVTVQPIPSSYIIPSGTIEVVNNGVVDVTEYASANINVPSSGGFTYTGVANSRVNTASTNSITVNFSGVPQIIVLTESSATTTLNIVTLNNSLGSMTMATDKYSWYWVNPGTITASLSSVTATITASGNNRNMIMTVIYK